MQVLSAKLSPIQNRLIETKLTIFAMAFAIGLICRKKSIAIALPFRKDHLNKIQEQTCLIVSATVLEQYISTEDI